MWLNKNTVFLSFQTRKIPLKVFALTSLSEWKRDEIIEILVLSMVKNGVILRYNHPRYLSKAALRFVDVSE